MMKYILLFVVLWGLNSCSSFLEPKSPSEYIPKNISSLNEMLLGDAYPLASGSRSLFAYHNVMDDDIEMTDEPITFGDNDIINEVGLRALFSWNPDMHILMEEVSLYKKVWSGYYQLIMGANAALDYLDEVSGTSEEKAFVKAH